MKTLRTRLAQFVAATALVGSLFAPGAIAHAEGGGSGGGSLPPPKPIVYTPDFVLYDDGVIGFPDGSYAYLY